MTTAAAESTASTAPPAAGSAARRRRLSPRQLRALVATALGLGLLLVGVARYWPFVTDDAFISFRYSARLLDGHGLTWTEGPPVEGYSNLAWVLACAWLGAFGLDMLTAARLLGVGCTALTIWLLARRFSTSWMASLVTLVLAAAAPIPVWAIGGLETPLLLLGLTGGFLQAERAVAGGRARPRLLLRAGLWFALACWTRPDAPLFVACAGLGVLWSVARRRRRFGAGLRAALLLAAVPAAAVLVQLLFRLYYYDDYLPNTARVKLVSGSAIEIAGRAYLQAALPVFTPLIAAAAAGALLALLYAPARAMALCWLLAAVAWTWYVGRIGGDIFAAWRVVVPALVPAVLLTGHLFERLADAGVYARRLGWVALVAVVALLKVQAVQDGLTERARHELWELDNRQIGLRLKEAFGDRRPLLALDAAGALPYYSELPCLDMLGLNDRTIARDQHRGGADSAFKAAHRRGSPDYLLARKPDLLFFDKPVPDDDSGLQLVDREQFAAGYRCVWFRCAGRTLDKPHLGELKAPLWVRIDGRVGVERTGGPGGDDVRVPAWLLAGYRHPPGMRMVPPADPEDLQSWLSRAEQADRWTRAPALAVPSAGGFALEVRKPGEYVLEGLELPPGSWRLEPVEPRPGLRLSLAGADGAPLQRAGDVWSVAPADAAGLQLRLEVSAAARLPVHLAEVMLRRRPPR